MVTATSCHIVVPWGNWYTEINFFTSHFTQSLVENSSIDWEKKMVLIKTLVKIDASFSMWIDFNEYP